MVGDETGLVSWNRQAALEEIENIKIIRAKSWEEHTHSFRWLMASLLAINSGACVAIFGHEGLPVTSQVWAGGAFLLGIIAALLVAVFGQHSVQRTLLPLQKIIGYWMTVVNDGVRNEKVEGELNDALIKAARLGKGTRLAGWISALAFISGVLISGAGIVKFDDFPWHPSEILEAELE